MHGTHDTVNRICDHPDIKAISFVGSNAAGQYIYERGSKNGKRVQVTEDKFCAVYFLDGMITVSMQDFSSQLVLLPVSSAFAGEYANQGGLRM